MALQKLSIFGFKSFADKTELRFGEGMTAVIGPNGCGKSNVIDAIRWVLGEQRESALRSSTMQDVIFSGTQRRQPLNMAEVTITIDNSRSFLPTDFSEVAVTRRIYRSGESEYLINRTPCRLRDIHNLFLDTGIGNSAYTTIENSMINSILSDKAEERRILFEEAAGICKYKERRRDSLRQLERTRQDLLRINDKVQEADRQVRMLARHVEKANRYKRYFDDLKTLEVGFENKRYAAFTDSMRKRQESLAQTDAERTALKAKIAEHEANMEKLQLSALEKEKELEQAGRKVAEANEKIIGLDRDISVSRERLGFLAENKARNEKEAVALDEQIAATGALRLQIEKAIIGHGTDLEACRRKVDRAKEELATFDARVQEFRHGADRLAAQQIELINETGRQRNVVSNLKSNLSNCLERCDHDERETAALQAKADEYRDAIALSQKQLAGEQEAYQNLSVSRESLVKRIEREDEKYQALVEREKQLEAGIDSGKAQLRFLEGLDASFEGYEAGVKALLKNKTAGVEGIVANLIKVDDDQMVGAIERALGTAIQTVVFRTDDELAAAARYLNAEKAGTSSMVSLERMGKRKRSSGRPTAIAGAVNLQAGIKAQDDYRDMVEGLFGQMWLTQSASEAMALSLEYPSETFVARDGTVCSGSGIVVAGTPKKQEAGLLRRKQQIDKLGLDIEKFQREYETTVHEKDICTINRDEAKFALVEVDEKLNSGRRKQQEQETTIKHYENEIRNIAAKAETLRAQLVKSKQLAADFEGKIREGEAALTALIEREQQIETSVMQSKEALLIVQKERNDHAEHLKNIELEMMGLANRLQQEKTDNQRLMDNIKEFERKKEKAIQERRQAETDTVDIEASLASKTEGLSVEKVQRGKLEQVRDAVRECYNGMQLELDDIRKTVRTDQARLEEVGNIVHAWEIEQTREDQEKRRIRERIWQTYEIDLESPPEGLLAVTDEDAAVIENISMFKERLKRLGEVNMAALSDFETENKRLGELTVQRDDLLKAVEDLDKAIKKLDREAREQFVATFDQVRKNFASMFTTLFEGGEAQVFLDEGADPLESPIHINVRPGGKKMRGVALLSGGERALTAISLLFALYMVKPSTYCILDELDAPLDDANIGRFVNLVRQFSERTQFIVVTHNKRTMEAADLLYGVTQQESGVSTIMSVKVEEAVLKAA
jgi:chromosome segregation protein